MDHLVITLPSDEILEAYQPVPQVTVHEWDLEGPPPVDHIDIVVPPYRGGAKRLGRLAEVSHVGLVQWQSIGVNGIARNLPPGIPVANATTVHETSTAELAVGLAIAAQRELATYVRAADQGAWLAKTSLSLADRRVLIVGYGGVGKAIEARLTGFEVQVERIASRARQELTQGGESVEVHGIESLRDWLAWAEIVMLAVPLSASTTGLLGVSELAAMQDDALLVNVARGPVVDADALGAELASGRLRAALDVTDPEPLPEGHPLWSLPNVLITPHVGGDTTAMTPRVVALLERQIAHALAGEPFENLIDLEAL